MLLIILIDAAKWMLFIIHKSRLGRVRLGQIWFKFCFQSIFGPTSGNIILQSRLGWAVVSQTNFVSCKYFGIWGQFKVGFQIASDSDMLDLIKVKLGNIDGAF